MEVNSEKTRSIKKENRKPNDGIGSADKKSMMWFKGRDCGWLSNCSSSLNIQKENKC